MWRASVVLLSVACAADPPATTGFLEPMDGQDAVPLDADLRLAGVAADLPPKAQLPRETIVVVDVARGGTVPGRVLRDGDDVYFQPDQSWRAESDYHWHVTEVVPQPRGTAWSLPTPLAGDATFSTRDRLRAVETVVGADGLCLVLSRPSLDPPKIEVTLDGEPVSVDWSLEPETAFRSLDLAITPPVGVLCAQLAADPALRIVVEGEVAPPPGDGTPADVIAERRRDTR
ncbi:MAG: hypothetical protein ACI8PZ_002759 [Myxococcota bacterium]|jgi:hypothetical protein